MLVFLFIFLTQAVSPNGNAGNTSLDHHHTATTLFNITVDHITERSIRVEWNCKGQRMYEKHEVTLQPFQATYKIVETVPHNTCWLSMDNLQPGTDYKISVTSIAGRTRRRSTSVFFRTPTEDSGELDGDADPDLLNPGEDHMTGLKFPHVKLVEISLVAMALILWAGAIVLFFHRWGKIRMLLPYQPPYNKMKQNCTSCSMTPHHQCSRLQHFQMAAKYGPTLGTAAAAVGIGATGLGLGLGLVSFTDTGCSPLRSQQRLNSVAISQDDVPAGMRIYRKALSCDHLPISDKLWVVGDDDDDDDDFSDVPKATSATSSTNKSTPPPLAPPTSGPDDEDEDEDDESVEYALLKNDLIV